MRKYLLNADLLPPLPQRLQRITQGFAYPVYVRIAEYQPGLRSAYMLYAGLFQPEDPTHIEIPLEPDTADRMIERMGNPAILIKHRCKLTIGSTIWEIEQYDAYMTEFEQRNYQTSRRVVIGTVSAAQEVLPPWAAADVTENLMFNRDSMILMNYGYGNEH